MLIVIFIYNEAHQAAKVSQVAVVVALPPAALLDLSLMQAKAQTCCGRVCISYLINLLLLLMRARLLGMHVRTQLPLIHPPACDSLHQFSLLTHALWAQRSRTFGHSLGVQLRLDDLRSGVSSLAAHSAPS